MSTYLIAEAAVLTVCRAVGSGTIFTATNSSRNDFVVVQSGEPYALVVSMGGDTEEGDDLRPPGISGRRGSQGCYQERHQILLTIYAAVGTGAAGFAAQTAALQQVVEDVKDYIRAHDRLGGVVSFARPMRTSRIRELVMKDRGATHLVQEVVLLVLCESEYPASEGGW